MMFGLRVFWKGGLLFILGARKACDALSSRDRHSMEPASTSPHEVPGTAFAYHQFDEESEIKNKRKIRVQEGSACIPAKDGEYSFLSSTTGLIIREYRNILAAKSAHEGVALSRRRVFFSDVCIGRRDFHGRADDSSICLLGRDVCDADAQ